MPNSLPWNARIAGPPGARITKRLNGIAGLSSDVYVTRARFAPAGFDARFSAIWRKYEYRVSDAGGPRNPLGRGYTLWFPTELDVDAMNAGAHALLGLHDWASFCKPRDVGTSIRTLQEFSWVRADDGILVATARADAFCHSMVRALVGAAVSVGEGKRSGAARSRISARQRARRPRAADARHPPPTRTRGVDRPVTSRLVLPPGVCACCAASELEPSTSQGSRRERSTERDSRSPHFDRRQIYCDAHLFTQTR